MRQTPSRWEQSDGPSYGRDAVLAALDEIGVELTDGDEEGWRHASCPITEHENRTADFSVNVGTGAWRCFKGCGSSRDLAHLVSQLTGDDVATSRRRIRMRAALASRSVSELVLGRRRPSTSAAGSRPEPLFYNRSSISRYMVDPKPQGRGFALETCRRWGVGHDRDLNAVVVPVRDEGRLVGLVRRCLNPGDPKYRNSQGMNARGYLLGLDLVDPLARTVVVVEGPMDCMWLDQHGYPAVAILGSSLSVGQADRLKRRFWKVVMAFDNDAAGQAATSKARSMLHPLELATVVLPAAVKDVQECDEETLERAFHHLM